MKIRSLLVALSTVAVTATTCSVAAPAHAAAPTGEVDGDWARVTCRTDDAGLVRCNIRVPGGFSSMKTTYMHGGVKLGSETTYTYEPRTRGPELEFTGRVTRDVRVTCGTRGNRAACVVEVAARVEAFQVIHWSAGEHWGGVLAEDLV